MEAGNDVNINLIVFHFFSSTGFRGFRVSSFEFRVPSLPISESEFGKSRIKQSDLSTFPPTSPRCPHSIGTPLTNSSRLRPLLVVFLLGLQKPLEE
ncbi:hypothetical protein H6P81_014908 [Aristolochia fimbriata]|uniref:Uncharacterized protein n=1 Tax=Aristolochia fimbriata TaxID=158543 RepID=A0AAV7E8I7_ARIFI|nr:hypothetical protein H6P81_014908 [Aristolochia fimbriata]